jgi:hypothetical protein
MEEVLSNTHSARGRHIRRAFRPLFLWLAISAGVLAWDYDRKASLRTTLSFTVTVEGKPATGVILYSARVGEKSAQAGGTVPIGWRTLIIELPDAEPFQKSMFIWYGNNDAGTIDLVWSRGNLDLKIAPEASTVHLAGPHHVLSLSNSYGTTASIPVGKYKVTTIFRYFSDQREIDITRNQTNRIGIEPPLATLSLSSEPGDASFRLTAHDGGRLLVQEKVPAKLTELPPGRYQIDMWRESDYVKTTNVTLVANQTNEIEVAFEYGEISIGSIPSEADVFRDRQQIGRTPLTVTKLKPGSYEFRIEKEGFYTIALPVEIRGRESLSLTTNLQNAGFTDAMSKARRFGIGTNPDYATALAALATVLKEKPEDPEALSMKSAFENKLSELSQAAAERQKRNERDANKRRAAEQFANATRIYKDVELFDTHLRSFNTDLQTMRGALLRAVRQTSIKWTIGIEERLSPNTILLHGTPSGFLVLGRRCSILLSEVGPGELEVYAKFWDYAAAGSALITDKFVPVHKSFFPPEQAVGVEQRRLEMANNFYKILAGQIVKP